MTTPKTRSSSFLHRSFSLLSSFAAFTLALALAIPVHAADARPIRQKVAPTYPELARRMRISGLVHVSATVAPDGSVLAAKTVSGNPMLSPAAESAVLRWKFAPAESQSTVEVDINFAPIQ
jgi:TonB family protein